MLRAATMSSYQRKIYMPFNPFILKVEPVVLDARWHAFGAEIHWLNWWRLIMNLTLRNRHKCNLNWNAKFFSPESTLEDVVYTMLAFMFRPLCFNSMQHKSGSTLAQHGLLAESTWPLLEPMLNDHQWGSVSLTEDQFYKKCSRYQLMKLIWKYTCKITSTSIRGQWVNKLRPWWSGEDHTVYHMKYTHGLSCVYV